LDSLPPVKSISWQPRNPVYANRVMTISWTPVEQATEYDVIILRDDNVQVLHQKVNTTSLKYTLQNVDIFHKLTATIYAYAEGYLPSPELSQTYHCGNSLG
jgi:hypothetical protein